MKKTVKFLSIIVIVISIIWCFKTGFDYEPIIVLVGSIITYLSSTFGGISNSAVVKGEGNRVVQRNSGEGTQKSNRIVVRGKKNEIDQDQ